MKSHNVIMKFVYGVVGLSIVVMIALTVYQQQQIKKISKTESPAASANKPSVKVPEKAADSSTIQQNAQTDIDELNRHRDASEKKLNTLRSPYVALFKELALPPEKQDAFKALLTDLQVQKTNLSMELLDTSISEEKRKEIQEHLETLESESNKKVSELLGKDNFEKYLTYEERLREKTIATTFLRSLPPDETLTEPQKQAFIDALYEERKKVEAARTQVNETSPPADLEIQISRIMDTTDQTYSGYMQVAGKYLSPSQTEQFKKFLDQRRDTMEMSLKAMRQVFGSNPSSNQSRNEPDKTAN